MPLTLLQVATDASDHIYNDACAGWTPGTTEQAMGSCKPDAWRHTTCFPDLTAWPPFPDVERLCGAFVVVEAIA